MVSQARSGQREAWQTDFKQIDLSDQIREIVPLLPSQWAALCTLHGSTVGQFSTLRQTDYGSDSRAVIAFLLPSG